MQSMMRPMCWIAILLAAVGLSAAWSVGCGGDFATDALWLVGYPFETGGAASSASGQQATGGSSSFFDTSDRSTIDPCQEPQERKFVTIVMRNMNPDDYIHYFLVLVARVSDPNDPNTAGAAVCPNDVPLYTAFGYTEIPAGQRQAFGDYCFEGRSLVYFHQNGRFRRAGGVGGTLASGIAPARGTSPTFDEFFTSNGARVPVPNVILFHNPGSGEGAALKISRNRDDPCGDSTIILAASRCNQDAFYYVDEQDLFAGSAALGTGSGRRVPSEIQGTGCECLGFADAGQGLAPSRTTASSARCNEFLRGGRIEYAFLRDDQNPPIPQLLWRVTDSSGSLASDFDPRAGIR
jgi:hypothetical protein